MGYIGTEYEVVTVPEPLVAPQFLPVKKPVEVPEQVPELVPVRRISEPVRREADK